MKRLKVLKIFFSNFYIFYTAESELFFIMNSGSFKRDHEEKRDKGNICASTVPIMEQQKNQVWKVDYLRLNC